MPGNAGHAGAPLDEARQADRAFDCEACDPPIPVPSLADLDEMLAALEKQKTTAPEPAP
jgi:hypothetical protein